MAAQRTVKYCPIKDHPGYYYVEGMIDWRSYPVATLAARKEFFEVTDYCYVLSTDVLSSIIGNNSHIVKMVIIPFDWVEGFQNRIDWFLGSNKPNITHVATEIFQRLSGFTVEEIKEIIETKEPAPKKTKQPMPPPPPGVYVNYIPEDPTPPTAAPPTMAELRAMRRG
jgi:hypothetical protein